MPSTHRVFSVRDVPLGVADHDLAGPAMTTTALTVSAASVGDTAVQPHQRAAGETGRVAGPNALPRRRSDGSPNSLQCRIVCRSYARGADLERVADRTSVTTALLIAAAV